MNIHKILSEHLESILLSEFSDATVEIRQGEKQGRESIRLMILPGGEAFPDEIATSSNSYGIGAQTYQTSGTIAYWRRFTVKLQFLMRSANRETSQDEAYELLARAERVLTESRVPSQTSDQGESAMLSLVVSSSLTETPIDKRPKWDGLIKVQFLTMKG